MPHRSRLVAHRGEMFRFAENTLPGIEAALNAGAQNIEFDIQFTKDQVPVLQHDFNLKRTTGRSGIIGQYTLQELKQLTILEFRKHGLNQPAGSIPTLLETITLLNEYALITSFVEIKTQSMAYFVMANCVDRVIKTMHRAPFPWTLISFDKEALAYAKQSHGLSIGWILRHHSDYSRKAAFKLRPDFIFCNIKKLRLSRDPYWIGPWRWVVYDIMESAFAKALLDQGVDMIETGAIVDMLSSASFKDPT